MFKKGSLKLSSLISKAWSNLFSSKENNLYFPFELSKVEGGYGITAPLESDKLYPLYHNFFKRNGYEGNGYTWEGHIVQILESLDEGLLDEIDFDPEAGGFYAYVDSKKAQQKFVKLLAPIFSDLEKLEIWVKRAEFDRIGD